MTHVAERTTSKRGLHRNNAQAQGKKPKKSGKQGKARTDEESLKWRVAKDLGLLDKVRRDGWGGLTSAESGRVGGIMTRILRQRKQENPSQREI